MAQISARRPAAEVHMLVARNVGNVEDYARRKLISGWQKQAIPFPVSFDVQHVIVDQDDIPLIFQHKTLSDSPDAELSEAIQCVKRQIDAMWPLLAGELVALDAFAYIGKGWEGLEAGTAVMVRKTDRATLFYILENVRVDPAMGKVRFIKTDRLSSSAATGGEREAIALGAALASSLPKSIAVDVAKKIADQMAKDAIKAFAGNLTQLAGGVVAGAIAGAIVSGFLDLLFPEDKKSTLDAYFEGLQAILAQELERETTDTIAGVFANLRAEIINVYAPARLQSDLSKEIDRKNLYEYHLAKYGDAFFLGPNGMLGTLMDEKHRLSCFPIFLLGASLHLAILQEIANVDPTNRAPDFNPLQSSYGLPKTGSVANYAKQYADFADMVWPLMRKRRTERVTYHTGVQPIFRHFIHYGYYVDEAVSDAWLGRINFEYDTDKNGNQTPRPGHGPDDVKRDMQNYINANLQELEDSIPQRKAIVESWRGLVDKPLNTVAGVDPLQLPAG